MDVNLEVIEDTVTNLTTHPLIQGEIDITTTETYATTKIIMTATTDMIDSIGTEVRKGKGPHHLGEMTTRDAAQYPNPAHH